MSGCDDKRKILPYGQRLVYIARVNVERHFFKNSPKADDQALVIGRETLSSERDMKPISNQSKTMKIGCSTVDLSDDL